MGYVKGLKLVQKELNEDRDYQHYRGQGAMIRENEDLIASIGPVHRKEIRGLRAHRLINMVQDNVRTQMIQEMQVEDEEARAKRL